MKKPEFTKKEKEAIEILGEHLFKNRDYYSKENGGLITYRKDKLISVFLIHPK